MSYSDSLRLPVEERTLREAWASRTRQAVATYEARRGSLAAIVELAAVLRARQVELGEGVAVVGGYRYRLDPADASDVIRERLDAPVRRTCYS